MKRIRWNGELGDGQIHMTAREYCEHKVAEDHEKHRQLLRKLSGNPILTDEARKALRYAVYILDDNIWLRKQCADILETNRTMKKAIYGNFYEKQEANKKLKARNEQNEGI